MEPSVTFTSPISAWTDYQAKRAVRDVDYLFVWSFFVVLPLGIILVMLCTGERVSLRGWMILLAGILIAFVRPLMLLNFVWAYCRRNRARDVVQTYTITPESYSVTGERFSVDLKWDTFLKADETRRFIVLYASTDSAHFIPKAAITSDSDFRAVRAMIRESLGPEARLEKEVEGGPGQ